MRNFYRVIRATLIMTILGGLAGRASAGDEPVITQQPESLAVCDGGSASFTVYASGEGLSYQWRKNGQDIDGAQNHTLNLTAVTDADEADYDVVVENTYGSVTSDPAALSVDAGPVISQDPENQDVCTGADVVLTVTASTLVGELSYAWYKDSLPVDGGDSVSLILNDIATDDAGSYHVSVTSDCGSLASDPAVLNVDAGPIVTEQPENLSACAGDEVTISVTAVTQVGELTYEWYLDDELIDGAEDPSLILASAAMEDAGEYYAIITSDCGSTPSASAVLTVSAGPVIVEQPAGAAVCVEEDYTLSVEVDNSGAIYQDVIGSTASSYNAARLRGNYFRATKTIALTRIEQYLSITSSSELVFFVYEADSEEGPYALALEDTVGDSGTGTGYFASNPLNFEIQEGQYYMIGAGWSASHISYWNDTHGAESFGMSLKAYSSSWTAPLPDPLPSSSNTNAYMQRITTSDLAVTYQWWKDDEAVPGASGEEHVIVNMSEQDAGEYIVAIDSNCGTVYSDAALVSIHSPVTFTQQPEALFICAGDEAVFQVVAEGGGTITYQWRKDGEEIEDATSSIYQITAVDPNDVGLYDVIVDNGCPETSAAAQLTMVESLPDITQQPQSLDACQGQPATLTVVVAGTPEQHQYQWFKDDAEIEGAEDADYSIAVVDPNDAGDYYVTVTNPCGSSSSTTATLLVDETLGIVTQPQGPISNDLCDGADWVFSVSADGTNVTYQWRKDDVDIEDAVEDSFTIFDADPNDAGDYCVVVSNNCGDLVSDIVGIGVVSDPVILKHPQDQMLRLGDRLELDARFDLSTFNADLDEIGMADLPPPPGGNKLRGNSYAVDETTTLTLIEQYLDVTTAGPLMFFVYESTSGPDGPYELLLEDTVESSGTGLQYYASNPIEARLEAGHHYIIGAGWEQTNVYYRADASHPVTTAFGATVAGYADPYGGALPTNPVPDQSNVWHQRVTTVSVVGYCQWRKGGVDLPGADSDVYVVESVTVADAGSYDVTSTNACGEVLSEPANVKLVSMTPGLSGSTQHTECVPKP